MTLKTAVRGVRVLVVEENDRSRNFKLLGFLEEEKESLEGSLNNSTKSPKSKLAELE